MCLIVAMLALAEKFGTTRLSWRFGQIDLQLPQYLVLILEGYRSSCALPSINKTHPNLVIPNLIAKWFATLRITWFYGSCYQVSDIRGRYQGSTYINGKT